jgi:hypothetical protein
MKEVVLTISKTVTSDVSVWVPDEFDESLLMRMIYMDAVRHAILDQDPEWDEYDPNYDVEGVGPPSPEDDGKFAITDICDQIATIQQREQPT